MGQRVAIIGSRGFPSKHVVEAYVAALPKGTVIVSGGARGADTFGAEAARANGLEVIIHYADWRALGRKAGPIRNEKIVGSSDHVTAFWDLRSRGTLNTLVMARETGLPTTIFGPAGEEIPLESAMLAADELGVLAGLKKARMF